MNHINRLFALRDEAYASFQGNLVPTVAPDRIIGVRTPALRNLAAEMVKEGCDKDFISELPHRYFEEDQLHAFVVSLVKDYGRCVEEVDRFLPYVDNWATCDQLSHKCFGRHRLELLGYVERWIGSNHVYTVRFAMGMLMRHYLDDAFKKLYLDMVADVSSEEYYIRMMQAWYFATALAKQYESSLPYIEGRRLPQWTHNKAIQKAVESFRVTEEHKEFLKSLRWK